MRIFKQQIYQLILGIVVICCCGIFVCQNDVFADKTVSAKFPVKTSDFSFVEKPDESGKIACDLETQNPCAISPSGGSCIQYSWKCDDGRTFGPLPSYFSPPEGYRERGAPSSKQFLINSFSKYSSDVWFSTPVNDDWKITGDVTSGTIAVSGATTVATLSFESESHQIKIKKNDKVCANVSYLTNGTTQFQDVMYDLVWQAQHNCLNETIVYDGNRLSEWADDHLKSQESFVFSELQDQLNRVPFTFFNGNSYSVNTGVDGPEFKDGEADVKPVPPDQTGQNKATCTNSAGAMGWVLCPLLEGAGNTIQTFYENVIKPLLVIEPELIGSSNPNAGAYGAWNMMRNFANIAFVILLLVVIFSQLTGVGIDNYGIKKILPKLIVVAILVNLSYLICQVLVDVSNIIGTSLDSFLTSMGNSLGTNVDVGVNGESLGKAGGTSAVIGGIGGIAGVGVLVVIIKGIIAGGAFLSVLGSLLWGVFIIALIVGVALIVFFTMLAVRKAGVILLVVIAPLAIVCYMLPNTQPLFNKWKKAFTTLLVLFPICGLVVGGGNLAAQIILKSGQASDNFWLALVAMAASIIPVFCIPFLLKSAMQAFGTLGAKLSGLTGKGKVLAGKVKGTNAYKNSRARSSMLTKRGIYGGTGRTAKIMQGLPGGKRRAQAAITAFNKDRADSISAERTIMNEDPNLDTEVLAGEYATLLQKDSWTKQDSIRAEALHQEIGGRAGGGGVLNSLIAGKHGENEFTNNHLSDMQAFNRRDAKSAGAAFEKSPPHSHYLQACTAGYQGKFKDWIKTDAGTKAIQGMSNKDLVHMKESSIKDISSRLTADQLSTALGSDDLGKAEFAGVAQALRDAQTSQQQRYNDAARTYTSPNISQNERDQASATMQELIQMGFGPQNNP